MKSDKPTNRPPILVSACLLGIPCRYDGATKPHAALLAYKDCAFVPFCPEVYGGLATPRPPAEIQPDGCVRTQAGLDVTAAYKKGAAAAVALCQRLGIHTAILKSRSPSCGIDTTYDGSFSRTLTNRSGICAQALREAGLALYSEETFAELCPSAPPKE